MNAGFRLVIGSWKIIEISCERTRRISSAGIESRSRPSKCTAPTVRPTFGGMSLITDSAVTVLPHPLSPTRPTVSPGATVKLTSSVTRSHPAAVANSTHSWSMESSGVAESGSESAPGPTAGTELTGGAPRSLRRP